MRRVITLRMKTFDTPGSWLSYRFSLRALLVNADLLAKVKVIVDASQSNLLQGCCQVSAKMDSSDCQNFADFHRGAALAKAGPAEARGMNLGPGAALAKAGRGICCVTS